MSLPYLDYLSQSCDCNVLAYEYCGYSIAQGELSEQNCYECIQAAYDYLTTITTENERCPVWTVAGDRCVNAGLLSKMGEDAIVHVLTFSDLFSMFFLGPTVDLAAELCTQNVNIAGVVLQSPLESAGRCVLGETASFILYFLDIFRSYEKIGKLAPLPVFIMHGSRDQVVPVSNGQGMYQSLTKAQKTFTNGSTNSGDDHYRSVACPLLWIPDTGHNDMPEFECIQNIAKFLKFLRERQ